MPSDPSKNTSSQKKSRTKSKTKSKHGNANKNKPTNRTDSIREKDFVQLTSANLSSLRWEDTLSDPILEEIRIEQYKELRRQRYIDAQQQFIDKKKDSTCR